MTSVLLALWAAGATPATDTAMAFAVAMSAPSPVALTAHTADPARAAVKVVRHLPGGGTGFGSGVVVFAGGGQCAVLTNRHVCPDPGMGITVHWPDGTRGAARWLGCDDAADLCCLAVQAPPGVAVAPPAEAEPAAGVTLVQVGYPGGGAAVRRQGPALGERSFDPATGTPAYFVGLGTVPGDSGSGVYDADGRVVAVVWGGDGRQARCVPARFVRRFLASRCVVAWFPGLAGTPTAQAPRPPQAPPIGAVTGVHRADPPGVWRRPAFVPICSPRG